MNKLSLFLMLTMLVLVLTAPVMADVKADRPEYRFDSVVQMRSSTASTVDISATTPWQVAANNSGYTTSFTLNNSQLEMLGVYLDVTAVTSGTHTLTLEGANGGTAAANFGVFEEAGSVSVTSATTAAPMTTLQTRSKASISVVGNKCIIMRNIPLYKYYRFHLDADASNGPFTATDFSITRR